jgi:NAD-dependent SIR2 family protein deacetylase
MTQLHDDALSAAAAAINDADALLITAGAGMGVDSGLPDFRGPAGFWQAYPAFDRLGLQFQDIANPAVFRSDPALAWGFYAHRLHQYRTANPHRGYGLLLQWAAAKPAGYFVFTSNVDGHFLRAGFNEERIAECHGSIHFVQCASPCNSDIWPADHLQLPVDPKTCRIQCEPPKCHDCDDIARPNVLMFDDYTWLNQRTAAQWIEYRRWLAALGSAKLAIIELGAGRAVPTVRRESERVTAQHHGRLIRINTSEPETPTGHHALRGGALEMLTQLAQRIAR